MKRRTTRKNETDEISNALQGQGRNRKKERKQSDGLVRVRGLGERNDDA